MNLLLSKRKAMIGELAESHSALLHECLRALADSLQRHFQRAKLLRTQLREHFVHLSGKLSESRNDEFFATRS